MDPIALHDGRILMVHEQSQCAAEHCPLHNPSEHPLNTAPLAWQQEIKAMFRVCEHNRGHPDPDSLDYLAATGNFLMVEAIYSVHIDHCDGCCQ